jgi:hypothetical protein
MGKFVYPDVWPASMLSGIDRTVSNIVLEIMSVVLVVAISYFRGFGDAALRSIWELIVAVHGASGHVLAASVGPLVIGLGSGLLWYVCHSLTHRVTGGHITGLDTVAFGLMGYLGRVPSKKVTLASYLWNLVKMALFCGAIYGGLVLGALTAKDMIKANPIDGGMEPHASLLGREGFYFLLPLISSSLFVAARLYTGNPFVDGQPSAAGLVSSIVAVFAAISAYVGNNGHTDFILPLAIATVTTGKLKDFGFAILGFFGGMFLGMLVYVLHCLQHVMQNNIFGNSSSKRASP